MNKKSEVWIDIRSEESFRASHVKGSHNFPADNLSRRLFELPPKAASNLVFVTEDCTTEPVCIEAVRRSGWSVVRVLTFSAIENLVLESGLVPYNRCWKPSPLVEKVCAHLEEGMLVGGIAVDVGCGSGRDMSFLASRGWTVIGLDNRRKLLQDAVSLGNRFLEPMGTGTVSALLTTVVTFLPFRKKSVDLVVVVRFLERRLLLDLFGTIRVGGFLLYSHFVDGVQHSKVGTPKCPSAFLKHGELRALCGTLPFEVEILIDEESTIDDDRPIVNFLCKRLS